MRNQSWPTERQYVEAIADRQSLLPLEFRSGGVHLRPGGLPETYAGSFATTFHLDTLRGEVAFRCYTRGYEGLERRYAAIEALLRHLRLGALCQTRYVPEAILVAGHPWPAVIMDWVSGRTLHAEIGRLVAAGDRDALLALAMAFRESIQTLEALGIAHGDLQHANILVSDGSLRLIDYDAMFLPAIADLAQVEFGHRNYQHPQRRFAAFDNRLDRFSSIVIYTGLVALAADPSLWTRFNDGESVLFRAHDFTSNGESDLLRTLRTSNATSGLAAVLIAAAAGAVDAVPSLDHAIGSSAGTIVANAPLRAPLPPRPAQRPAAPPTAQRTPVATPIPRARRRNASASSSSPSRRESAVRYTAAR
ncbi:MAG: hypothetical protein NVS2B3_18420 [Vulcanimicrobiaceae bacterium]